MIDVIIIDDDSLNNYICSLLIKKKNNVNNIKSFVDPREALLSISSAPVNPNTIIFLDLNMPVMNAWKFLDECKILNINCIVYILTSSLSLVDQEIAKKYPIIKGFFIKPLTFDIVNDIIQ